LKKKKQKNFYLLWALALLAAEAWMAGSSPAMTIEAP